MCIGPRPSPDGYGEVTSLIPFSERGRDRASATKAIGPQRARQRGAETTSGNGNGKYLGRSDLCQEPMFPIPEAT